MEPTPPKWASDIAWFLDRTIVNRADKIAHALASVRDAALREAAGVSNVLAAEFELNRDAYSDAKAKGADECTDAILSLVGTAPKQTEKEAPRG